VSACERFSHSLETTQLVWGVTESGLLLRAVSIGDAVDLVDSGPGILGVGNDFTTLDVKSANLGEITSLSTVRSDELGNNGELALGVDGESRSVEGLVTLTERVEIATILVADTLVSLISITALDSSAGQKTGGLADVRSVGSRDGVGLPDVHLGAAGTVGTGSSIGVGRRSGPSLNVCLSGNHLQVVWALRIAVTGTIFGTSLICWVLGHTTVLVHFDEVDGTVQTARQVGNVNVHGELGVLEVDSQVGSVGVHQEDTGTNVGTAALGDELEGQGVTAGGDTIGSGIVGTLKSAVGGAGDIIWAESSIPLVTGVTVGVTTCSVEPSPVGINDNLGALSSAARRGTLVRSKGRMDLSSVGTNLLGSCESDEGREESDFAECRHLEVECRI